MTDTIEKILKEMDELDVKLARLEKEKREFEKLNPEHRLAIGIHDLVCRSNHEDQCGWYYEIPDGIHDWSRYAHADALEKAKRVLSLAEKTNVSVDIFIESYKLLKG